jgi:hypothetical protein
LCRRWTKKIPPEDPEVLVQTCRIRPISDWSPHRKAIARKASALVGALQMETGIRLKALRLPLADLEQRIAAFDEAVSRFEAERRTAADLLEIPFQAPESSDSFEVRHDPFWVTSARTELFGAIAPRVLDRFLPQATRQVRLRRRLVEEMEAACFAWPPERLAKEMEDGDSALV